MSGDNLESRAGSNVTPEQMKAAKEEQIKYWGLFAAAARSQAAQNGSYVLDNQAMHDPLTGAPISPLEIAKKALQDEIKATGNAELAAFYGTVKRFLGDQSLKELTQTYESNLQEKTVDELVGRAKELGYNAPGYDFLVRDYSGKKYNELVRETNEFNEKMAQAIRDKKPIDGQEQLKYMRLKDTLEMLRSDIDLAYQEKLREAAINLRHNLNGKLVEHDNTDNLAEVLDSDQTLTKARERVQEAIKTSHWYDDD